MQRLTKEQFMSLYKKDIIARKKREEAIYWDYHKARVTKAMRQHR